MEVKIKQVHPDMKKPVFAHPGDVGMDVFTRDAVTLQPGERYVFPLGFAMEFPEGWAVCFKDRSSMAVKYGMHVMGGVYDPGFRGEWSVGLVNLSQEPQEIHKHQKIAQALFYKIDIPTITVVEELSESSRGLGKHGSTGKF